jgi:hypothetical protein
MNNQLESFIDYLLDTETTSETAFIENIQKNNELFQLRYLKDWEHTVLRKLQEVHRNTNTSILNSVGNGQKSESDSSDDDEDSSTTSSDEEEENKDKKSDLNEQVNIQINYSLLIIPLYLGTSCE